MVYYTAMKKALLLLVIGVGLLLIYFVGTKNEQPAPAPVTPTKKPYVYKPEQDKHLRSVLLAVAEDDTFAKTIAIKYSNDLEDLERGVSTEIFDKNKVNHPQLYIAPGLGATQERTTVAHEYLHVAYGKAPNQDAVIADLNALYANDAYMQQRMAAYVARGIFSPTELFSVYCTESSDSYLTATVLRACNTLIDRSSLTFSR